MEAERFLEVADVGRAAGIGVDAVLYHIERGALRVAARTRRGVRLFRERDVRRWIEARAQARAARTETAA